MATIETLTKITRDEPPVAARIAGGVGSLNSGFEECLKNFVSANWGHTAMSRVSVPSQLWRRTACARPAATKPNSLASPLAASLLVMLAGQSHRTLN